MAFLVPENLQCLTLHYKGAIDNLTDVVLGYNRGPDMDIYYMDIFLDDASGTFDTTTITIEYDDGASGADTVVDANASGADTRQISVNRDALSASRIPGGSRFLLTVDNVSAGPDLGLTMQLWYVKGGEASA